MFAVETMKKEEKNFRMPVDVADIDPDMGLHLSLKFSSEEFFSSQDGVEPIGEVLVDLNVKKYGEDIYLDGYAKGKVRLQCGRCLENFENVLEAKIDSNHTLRDEGASEEDLDPMEAEVNNYDGETLELFDILHDNLTLSLPLKPLCSEECKGLCPKCGNNLNLSACGCPTKEVDSRFAILKKLKGLQ